jgi:hypothetical protein
LDEAEGNSGAVACPNERAVNINDRTGLADCSDVQHSLVLWFDGGCMGENQDWTFC